METVSLFSAAKSIIAEFNSSNDNSVNPIIVDNWKTIINILNQFTTYSEIPYQPDVPLAMYMYVMKYFSKRNEENTIRAITTFGVLMNAIEHTNGIEKLNYLVLVSSLITYYKKHFNNVRNFSLFPIKVPQVKDELYQTIMDYGNTTEYFDSILIDIYNHVNIDILSFFESNEIKSRFIHNKESFFNEYNQKQHGLVEKINAESVLRDCYNRMNQIGKCPIFVPSTTNTEICNKTYGLITHGQTFNVSRFFLHETPVTMAEGELNTQIKFDIQDGMIELLCKGIKEQYLKNEILVPIKDTFVEKTKQHIELMLDTRRTYRDENHRDGNVDNVPTSIDLHFEHFKLAQIELTFFVGEHGRMRSLHLYGECL